MKRLKLSVEHLDIHLVVSDIMGVVYIIFLIYRTFQIYFDSCLVRIYVVNIMPTIILCQLINIQDAFYAIIRISIYEHKPVACYR